MGGQVISLAQALHKPAEVGIVDQVREQHVLGNKVAKEAISLVWVERTRGRQRRRRFSVVGCFQVLAKGGSRRLLREELAAFIAVKTLRARRVHRPYVACPLAFDAVSDGRERLSNSQGLGMDDHGKGGGTGLVHVLTGGIGQGALSIVGGEMLSVLHLAPTGGGVEEVDHAAGEGVYPGSVVEGLPSKGGRAIGLLGSGGLLQELESGSGGRRGGARGLLGLGLLRI